MPNKEKNNFNLRENLRLLFKSPDTRRFLKLLVEHEASKETLRELLERAKYEIFPSKNIREQIGNLSRDRRITVTCPTRRGGIDVTLQATKELVNMGFQPIPHIAARHLLNETKLWAVLEKFQKLNIQEIFVVAGDIEKPVGKFKSAYDLLIAMQRMKFDFKIGITAYPEPHPKIDNATLLKALKYKEQFADYASTQMCFDPEVITNWINYIRGEGVQLPIHIGISGPSTMTSLMRFAAICGVGDSTRFLKSHSNLVSKMIKPKYRPDGLLSGLLPHLNNPDYNIGDLHIYTFNQIEKTENWRKEMLAYLE